MVCQVVQGYSRVMTSFKYNPCAAILVSAVCLNCLGVAKAQDQDQLLDAPVDEVSQIEEAPVEELPVAVATEADGYRYEMTGLVLEYATEHKDHPLLEDLEQATIELLLTEDGYIAPRPGYETQRVQLFQIADLPEQRFYGSAIREVSLSLVAELNRRGYIGVTVAPHPEDIDEEGEDVRPLDQTILRWLIRTAVVTELRTLGSGERVPTRERINHPVHALIKAGSPLQPGLEGEAQTGDLLRQDLLDDYVFRLNRHPGRRIDVALSAAQEDGGVALDYLISENRPWFAYLQYSNTGTEQTGKTRERAGLVHNQFTGRDDTLSLDFVTAEFDSSNAFIGSYDAPVFDSQYMRWRVFGSLSEFTASDVGQSGADFDGDSWSLGGDVTTNIFQFHDLFIDLVTGVRWDRIKVDGSTSGADDFFLPSLGLKLERVSEIASTFGSVSIETNLEDVADTNGAQNNLGRENATDSWTVMEWDFSHVFFLEPVLFSKDWNDPSTPEPGTLAHEISISFSGQYVVDDRRLIPQAEGTVGGLYSVRGYVESATAGDTVILGTVEYRYHIPRTFKPQPDPSKTPLFGKPFKFSPQQPYFRPDWDLVFRAFVDAGVALKNQQVAGEEDEHLLSAGLGFEFLFKRNVNLRLDWAVALEDAGEVEKGSNRGHFVVTLLY